MEWGERESERIEGKEKRESRGDTNITYNSYIPLKYHSFNDCSLTTQRGETKDSPSCQTTSIHPLEA